MSCTIIWRQKENNYTEQKSFHRVDSWIFSFLFCNKREGTSLPKVSLSFHLRAKRNQEGRKNLTSGHDDCKLLSTKYLTQVRILFTPPIRLRTTKYYSCSFWENVRPETLKGRNKGKEEGGSEGEVRRYINRYTYVHKLCLFSVYLTCNCLEGTCNFRISIVIYVKWTGV